MSQLFEQIDQVWRNDTDLNSDSDIESLYMIRRFISLHPDGFLSADDCNRCIGIPDWAGAMLLMYSTPRLPRAPWMKYPKSIMKIEPLSDKRKNALNKIHKRFNTNDLHSQQIFKILKKQGIDTETY